MLYMSLAHYGNRSVWNIIFLRYSAHQHWYIFFPRLETPFYENLRFFCVYGYNSMVLFLFYFMLFVIIIFQRQLNVKF